MIKEQEERRFSFIYLFQKDLISYKTFYRVAEMSQNLERYKREAANCEVSYYFTVITFAQA